MTLTLVEARETLAEALSTIDDLTVASQPGLKTPRVGDGWVTVGRVAPSDYTRCSVVLVANVILGNDVVAAENLLNTLAIEVIDAVTTIEELPVADVTLEPVTFALEGAITFNGFTVTVTTEVEQ